MKALVIPYSLSSLSARVCVPAAVYTCDTFCRLDVLAVRELRPRGDEIVGGRQNAVTGQRQSVCVDRRVGFDARGEIGHAPEQIGPGRVRRLRLVEHIGEGSTQQVDFDVAAQLEQALPERLHERRMLSLHLVDLLGDLGVVVAARRHERGELQHRGGEIRDREREGFQSAERITSPAPCPRRPRLDRVRRPRPAARVRGRRRGCRGSACPGSRSA